MGNIEPTYGGKASGVIHDKLIKLSGPYSIIGRSVMVHADPDDLGKGDHSQPGVNGKTSKTTGNAGARIACGEIVKRDTDPVFPICAVCEVGPNGKPCGGGDEQEPACHGWV